MGAGSARQVGLVDFHLRSAGWALDTVLDDLGDDPEPTVENAVTLQQMKRAITVACQEVAAIAAETAGGGPYARRGDIDRMIRDLRAALYHPYTPEAALTFAGRARLGLPLAA